MFGREVVEDEQPVPVLDKALDRLVVLRAIGLNEEVEGGLRVGLGLGHPDVLEMALGPGLLGFGNLVEHVDRLVHPAPLLANLAIYFAQRLNTDRADPDLDLPLRLVTMPDNTSTALAVGQIRMGGDMRFDFRFDRLRQKPTRTGSAENDPGWRNETTVSSFMAYPSFLETGDLVIARIRRPHITPSPRFGHNTLQNTSHL